MAGSVAGSGFVVDPAGLVATVAHIVEGGRAVRVTLPDGAVVEDATVVGVDAARDLGTGGLAAARYGCSAELRVGDAVIAIGNALAFGGDPTASAGIVSAFGREIGIDEARPVLEALVGRARAR